MRELVSRTDNTTTGAKRRSMPRHSASLIAAVFLASTALNASAQDEVQYKAGAWHYRSIPCAETTVASVTPR